VTWVETTSPHFAARHDEADAHDVVAVLELLEGTRAQLAVHFPAVPETVDVVVHGSLAQLDLATPYLPLVRRLTAPAARRYLVGWFGRSEIHVLAPRLLTARASKVPGSRELNLLAPAALFAHVVIGASNPRLPPPFNPRAFRRYPRWAWLAAGGAQWLSGQTEHAGPAIARRLHDGSNPSFPPGIRDAQLLGGTVLDLLAREEGAAACFELLLSPLPRDPRSVLRDAFGRRSLKHTEDAWRGHLRRLADVR
jgi:hypothetical protein